MTAHKSNFLRQGVLFGVFVSFITLIVCIASDAVRGPHGLIANGMLRLKIEAMRKELDTIKSQRARLERDAELLSAKAASQPELLDQQARELLDFARPTDIVIVNGEKAR